MQSCSSSSRLPNFALLRATRPCIHCQTWPRQSHARPIHKFRPFNDRLNASAPFQDAVRVAPATSANLQIERDIDNSTATAPVFSLACPICVTTPFGISRPSDEPLHCPRCQRTFNTDRDAGFVDLTLSSGADTAVYKESQWGGVQIFRNPLVSYVYERGWRQGFAWAGFPGEQREFEMSMDLLQPAYNDVLLDMSCGSGLFSRRFAASGRFSGVIAADYSESMLKQVRETFDSSGADYDGSVLILRADVGRLPFPTGSLAAVHAGAAIHCWPNPTAAMAEISRVLKPGGVFVASTFLKAAAPLGEVFGDDNVGFFNQIRDVEPKLRMVKLPVLRTTDFWDLQFDPTSSGSGRNYRWWDEGELKSLCQTVGLQNFQSERRLRFILFSVSKPRFVR